MSTRTYLQLPNRHQTMEFSTNQDGTMTVVTKVTMDPDEECDWQTVSKEEARIIWRDAVKSGFVKAKGYHQDKRAFDACYGD